MPQGDRTGPQGLGPLTGRRAGFCAGYDRPGFLNRGRGFGFGAGRGGGYGAGRGGGFGGQGRGWRNRFWATGNPNWSTRARFYDIPDYPAYSEPEFSNEEELKVLKTQTKILEKELSNMKKRMAELEGSVSG